MVQRPRAPDKSRRRPPPGQPRHGRGLPRPAVAERDLDRIAGLPAVQAQFEVAPRKVRRLFFTPDLAPAVAPFLDVLAVARLPYREVTSEELERIAGTAMHGGVLALAEPRGIGIAKAELLGPKGEPMLLLDGVGNPQNVGAIARTAAFFGVRRLLISDHEAQGGLSDASFRIAKGGLQHVDVLRVQNIAKFLADMKRSHRVVGTALADARPIAEALADIRAARKPVLVVLGNEEYGLSKIVRASCHDIVHLPGSGRVQSLNVSVTAGILIFTLLSGEPS